MRYSGFLKAVAILLATCALTVVLASGMGIVFAAGAGLYGKDYESWYQSHCAEEAERLATALAESYAARTLGNLTKQELRTIGWGNDPQTIGAWRGLTEGSWCYAITKNGLVYETDYTKAFSGQSDYRFDMTVWYPKKTTENGQWDESYYLYSDRREVVSEMDVAEPTMATGSDRLYIRMEESPEFVVTVYFMPDVITRYNGVPVEVCAFLAQQQYILMGVLAGGLTVALACLWRLLVMAGKTGKDGQARPGGLNRFPLDLYALAVAGICSAVFAGAVEITEEIFYYSGYTNLLWLILAALLVFFGFLCITAFLFALAAQGKLGIRAVWQRSVTGFCWGKVWRLLQRCFKALCKLLDLLPLIWKYLLVAFAMALFPVFFGFLCLTSYGFGRAFWMLALLGSLGADVAMLLYGAYAYGTILRGAEKMAAGELQTKISTVNLFGTYKRCGEHLNALGEVSLVAAKNQIKSERMKAELITNVSHDIKTPLTSIINYIDLLQKAQTQEEKTEYLQVLERQSQRLKKLIEDLMDMSKASTGNLAVEIARVDAVEAINQALGEFADKMKDRSLNVVFSQPETEVPVLADGKLTWRVLSNILGNVVKYAMPGTRVYVDVEQTTEQVTVSIKNISGEPLNVSAEELMERFVRGDASRNTEGSGLGLNIAQSLMQLQKGSLQLVVDGDLFKTILTFPVG